MMLDNQESLFVGDGTAANLPGNRLRGENLPHFPIGADVCDCALLIDDYKIAIVDAERVDADDFMVAVKNGGFSSGKNGKRGEAIAILLFGECDDVHVLGLTFVEQWIQEGKREVLGSDLSSLQLPGVCYRTTTSQYSTETKDKYFIVIKAYTSQILLEIHTQTLAIAIR